MNKYAVIRFFKRQYIVKKGDELIVDKLKDVKTSPEVLLVVDGGKLKVGKPVVKDIKIKFRTIEEIKKGKKLHVRKYKAKSRYRKKIGFRPQYSKILIEKIV